MPLTLSQAASLMGRARRGIKQRVSARQIEHCRRASLVSHAVQRGDLCGAELYRWLYWPERMRARQLALEAGLPAPK